MSPTSRPAIRVMTWNIHGALGRNPRFDLARVVGWCGAMRPTSSPCRRSIRAGPARRSGDPFDVLQEALGDHGIGAKTITTADGDTARR